MHKLIRLFLSQLLLSLPLAACASGTSIEKLLASDDVPAGVVIEIVTGDNQGLSWALPQAKAYIKQIRQRFPAIPIAIVTHGREQFALQESKSGTQAKVHSLTRSLQKDHVQLHVCGTYAGWKGLSKEDFPDYVDVAPAGPAQINDYLALDYQLLVIKRREVK